MASMLPATQEIREIVTEELALAGGTISDTVEDGDRLFLRSLLPRSDEIQPKDVVEGGIAVMADETEIQVHPYLLRQVCRNGAIMPQLIQSRSIPRVAFDAPSYDVEAVVAELREALSCCSAPEVFSTAAQRFSMAALRSADLTVVQLLMLPSISRRATAGLRAEILRRFRRDRDRSMFGLVNAVTSVARDQRDPEVRWRLEEMGGGMLARKPPAAKPGGCAAQLVRV